MEFNQVLFTAEMLTEKEVKQEKQLMRASALHAWLTGFAPKKTYIDFINSLGVGEDRIFTKEDKQAAIKKSDEVMERLNKIRGKKTNDGNI